MVNISRYPSYLYSTRYYKLIVDSKESETQEPTDEWALNIDELELGEVTAYGEILSMRTQSHRNSKDIINTDVAKDDSGLCTSMKPSNERLKGKPWEKPELKIRSDLFVETSKRLKTFMSKDNKYYNINNLLGDPYFLIACYENIKSKSGNMTKGIDNYTLDGINGKWFIETAKKLKSGTYYFNAARLVDIPKIIGKTRTLSITSSRDKIVQKAVALILEAIYEPLFKNTSFGFRRKLGTHEALNRIKLQGAAYR